MLVIFLLLLKTYLVQTDLYIVKMQMCKYVCLNVISKDMYV